MAANGIAKTVGKLVLVVAAMFAFVFVVMVPLYDMVCQAWGINGRSEDQAYSMVSTAVDKSRSVKVQFIAVNAAGMPWQFHPVETSVTVHPGAANTIEYYAKNVTSRDMVAHAVPSFVPALAARYFHQAESTAFQRQSLKAGAAAKLPMQFVVDRALPKVVSEITVSYTIFDVTQMDRTGGKQVALH